jgi:hypothetical protein
MGAMVKYWLANLIQNELDDIKGKIREADMCEDIASLAEYKDTLKSIKKQIMEGTINV